MKNKSESIETTCELARAYATIKAYEVKYGPLIPPVDNAYVAEGCEKFTNPPVLPSNPDECRYLFITNTESTQLSNSPPTSKAFELWSKSELLIFKIEGSTVWEPDGSGLWRLVSKIVGPRHTCRHDIPFDKHCPDCSVTGGEKDQKVRRA